MAREVEAVVVRDLSRLAAAPAPARGRAGDETACRRALDRAQRKLRRLYELYAEGEDDTLREAIEAAAGALSDPAKQPWIITEDGEVLSPNWIRTYLN